MRKVILLVVSALALIGCSESIPTPVITDGPVTLNPLTTGANIMEDTAEVFTTTTTTPRGHVGRGLL